MSFVQTFPEHIAAAAANLASLGAALNTGSAAAAGPITGVVPPAVDEVSILTATHFAMHGQRFQELSEQAARIQATMTGTLASNGVSYADTEAANAALTHI
jgi:hypothetical protein